LLERLAARGVTMFLTSHVLDVVEKLCTRVALLVAGVKVAEVDLVDLRASGRTLDDLFAEHAGAPATEREIPWLA
jgi:ABC-2 type transport system ATP-binding protein